MKYFYNDKGIVQRKGNYVTPGSDTNFIEIDDEEVDKLQLADLEIDIEAKTYTIVKKERINRETFVYPDPTVDDIRRHEYKGIGDQLDMLYHDIANGKFGDGPKVGDWFKHISNIKKTNPKIDK